MFPCCIAAFVFLLVSSKVQYGRVDVSEEAWSAAFDVMYRPLEDGFEVVAPGYRLWVGISAQAPAAEVARYPLNSKEAAHLQSVAKSREGELLLCHMLSLDKALGATVCPQETPMENSVSGINAVCDHIVSRSINVGSEESEFDTGYAAVLVKTTEQTSTTLLEMTFPWLDTLTRMLYVIGASFRAPETGGTAAITQFDPIPSSLQPTCFIMFANSQGATYHCPSRGGARSSRVSFSGKAVRLSPKTFKTFFDTYAAEHKAEWFHLGDDVEFKPYAAQVPFDSINVWPYPTWSAYWIANNVMEMVEDAGIRTLAFADSVKIRGKYCMPTETIESFDALIPDNYVDVATETIVRFDHFEAMTVAQLRKIIRDLALIVPFMKINMFTQTNVFLDVSTKEIVVGPVMPRRGSSEPQLSYAMYEQLLGEIRGIHARKNTFGAM